MQLTSLHGRTLATCELGEVAPTVAMQGDAAAEASPADPDVVQGRSPSSLSQSLFADRKQRRATALVLGAHDHEPSALRRRSGGTARPL
jgi:hypothetical protein